MLHCIVQHPRRCFWLLQFIVDAARHSKNKDGLVNFKLEKTETLGIFCLFLQVIEVSLLLSFSKMDKKRSIYLLKITNLGGHKLHLFVCVCDFTLVRTDDQAKPKTEPAPPPPKKTFYLFKYKSNFLAAKSISEHLEGLNSSSLQDPKSLCAGANKPVKINSNKWFSPSSSCLQT